MFWLGETSYIYNKVRCMNNIQYNFCKDSNRMARAVILLIALCCGQALTQNRELQTITESNSKFSRDFLKALNSVQGNLVSSPLSAHLALAMTQLGAGGKTATVMSSALYLPSDKTTSNEGFKQLTSTLQGANSESVKLSIANRIYLKTGFDVKKEFLNDNKNIFNSEPQSVNFVHPTTRNFINQWVEHATQNKIKDLIQEGVLDGLTRLLLINTLYFNGKWAKSFGNAGKGQFYTSNSNAIQVPVMKTDDSPLKYQEIANLQATLIEIPYMGDKISMVILMPNSRTGLSDLEKKMQTQDLSVLVNSAKSAHLELTMPKFKIESTLDLKEPLTKLGMENIFGADADFTGINAVQPLRVNKVLQKTIIQVAENGTEASSATFVDVGTRAGRGKKVAVNHPFLFYLVHKTTNSSQAVLFSGRVMKPEGY